MILHQAARSLAVSALTLAPLQTAWAQGPEAQFRELVSTQTGVVEDTLPRSNRLEQWLAVQDWATAWQKQDVEAYLAAYSLRFEPESHESKTEWARERRRRIGAPKSIRISLALIDIETGPSRSVVRFLQSYTTASYHDVVTKRLELILEAGRWRILHEIVENG